MITGFLAWFRALPIMTKGVTIFVAIGLVWVGVQIVNHFIDRAFDSAETAGAAQASADAANAGLAKVEKANAAEEAIARDPDVRRADCLRDSRTPANC